MLRINNSKNLQIIYNKINKKTLRNFHKIQLKNTTNDLSIKSSKIIRQDFINFFKNHNHKYVRSSKVVPLCDPSVSFINAGMNQFKGIFLNNHPPPANRVTNSQKCIRVGGKHNDLNEVGHDSYHHTFFEMLGNWSFNDYKKFEACNYAWNLLTNTFGINKNRLYVTYFKGDEYLNLQPDYETKEIWKSIGVNDDRIIPFGLKDNFWEMGLSGPCGPCTEIHIDHNNSSDNQAFKLNQGHSDLTELWNIVFIDHQRLQDGTITPLDTQHIDTGMGFERLVTILQNKNSNYDTDLFQPLFDVIQKKSGCINYQGKFGEFDIGGIDTAYRIVSDHARMITVALADGVVPEENYKLRRVLRKATSIGIEIFHCDNLLHELSYHVADNLGDVYPEIKKNITQVQKIIDHEKELLIALRKTSGKEWQEIVKDRPILKTISEQYAPGLVPGYKLLQSEILNNKINKISGELAFILYDRHGIDLETTSELAKVEGLAVDVNEYHKYMENIKMRSRIGLTQVDESFISQETLSVLKSRIEPTDDSHKYNYSFENNQHQFPRLETKITGIIINGNLIEGNSMQLEKQNLKNLHIGIVLEKTSMYAPEGGQQSDCGKIQIKNISIDIKKVIKIQDIVIHFGSIDPSSLINENEILNIGDNAIVNLNEEKRLGFMRHHTATHLLNAALRKIYPAIAQRGSVVKDEHLVFIFNGFGIKITQNDVELLEKIINDAINSRLSIVTKEINGIELMGDMDLTLVPGENYPSNGIRIVEIEGPELKSREACCGTHVLNTSALEYFKIIEVNTKGPSSRMIKAVAGSKAKDLKSASKNLQKPFINSENLKSQNTREMVKAFIHLEMENAIKINKYPYLVHCIKLNNMEVESIPLQNAIDYSINSPVFLIVKNNRKLKARCFVPKEFITDKFNAKLWMEHVSPIIKSKIGSFNDENSLEISHTRVVKLSREELDDLSKKAIEKAQYFVSNNFVKI